MSVQAEPTAAFELSRPAPPGVKLAFAALFALSLASLPGAVVITLAVCSPGGNGFVWLHELAAGTPFGLAPWIGTAIALLALTLVTDKLYQARARRRWGRCRIDDDELLFEPCLGGGEERVPLDDVTGFAVTPHGVIVELLDRPPLQRWTRPLLIPTRNGEEQARVLAHLEAPREHAPGQASFGRARPPWVRLALGFALLLLSAPALVLFALRFGQLALTFVAAPVVFLQVPGLLLFERRVLGPRWTPVHFGRRALFWEDRRVAWEDVTRVAWSETDLIVEAVRRDSLPPNGASERQRASQRRGEARLRTRVAPRLEEAKRLLSRRLAGAGSRLEPDAPVPAWAGVEARRRWGKVLALVLAVPLLAIGLAMSNPPMHASVGFSDDAGTFLILYHRISDDAPARLRLTNPDEWQLDVDVSGEDAFLTRAVRMVQDHGRMPDVAAFLDLHVSGDEDPVLRNWLEGRTGHRVFRVADRTGWELAWAAEEGAVTLCALVRPRAQVMVSLGRDFAGEHTVWIHYRGAARTARCGGPDKIYDHTRPLLRIDGPGDILAFAGPLPELDELLRATRAIRSGATIAESSRELKQLMEAR